MKPLIDRSRPGWWRILVFALLLVGVLTSPVRAAQPTQLNAAGLVINHGDGTVLYFYVQFSEPEITGAQLLERAGVSIDETPYAGIGEAICRIDGEGCPATNCFCKSFANPAVYWRYHKLGPDGNWVFLPSGPDARQVRNGDVDGWSWSSKDGDLPPSVTLAQIAQINDVTISTTPAVAATSAVTATTTEATPSPTATAATFTSSPIVVGAEVKPSGQPTRVDTASIGNHPDRSNYLWFGLGILVLALVAIGVLLRARLSRR
ncbi:MAG: hypothetical protein WBW04_05490 [Nitrolancea sp.]